jgi:hypothetical protein
MSAPDEQVVELRDLAASARQFSTIDPEESFGHRGLLILAGKIERAADRIEALLQALEPFAEISSVSYPEIPGSPPFATHYWTVVGHPGKSHFTHEDLVLARAAMKGNVDDGRGPVPEAIAPAEEVQGQPDETSG